jgi:hypothetical protein
MNEDTSPTPSPAPIKQKLKLIKKSEVRKLALAFAEERRRKGGRHFTRVGSAFYEAAEGHLRNWIAQRVHSAPSVGKTLE